MSFLVAVFIMAVAAKLILNGIFRLFIAIIKGIFKVTVFLVFLPVKAYAFIVAFFKKN